MSGRGGPRRPDGLGMAPQQLGHVEKILGPSSAQLERMSPSRSTTRATRRRWQRRTAELSASGTSGGRTFETDPFDHAAYAPGDGIVESVAALDRADDARATKPVDDLARRERRDEVDVVRGAHVAPGRERETPDHHSGVAQRGGEAEGGLFEILPSRTAQRVLPSRSRMATALTAKARFRFARIDRTSAGCGFVGSGGKRLRSSRLLPVQLHDPGDGQLVEPAGAPDAGWPRLRPAPDEAGRLEPPQQRVQRSRPKDGRIARQPPGRRGDRRSRRRPVAQREHDERFGRQDGHGDIISSINIISPHEDRSLESAAPSTRLRVHPHENAALGDRVLGVALGLGRRPRLVPRLAQRQRREDDEQRRDRGDLQVEVDEAVEEHAGERGEEPRVAARGGESGERGPQADRAGRARPSRRAAAPSRCAPRGTTRGRAGLGRAVADGRAARERRRDRLGRPRRRPLRAAPTPARARARRRRRRSRSRWPSAAPS